MSNYNIFAQFYDEAMGGRQAEAEMVQTIISKYHPRAKTLLELGCGTGAILKHLSGTYEVAGLDLSQGMLKVAKKELPKIALYQQSMVDFSVPKKFDVIICVFDSINHLLAFKDWKSLFSHVVQHLNQGGVFLFDVNTPLKLELMQAQKPSIRKFGEHYLSMSVVPEARGVVHWNVQIFQHQKKNMYALFEEEIQEIAFPLSLIKEGLQEYFKHIHVIDLKRKRPSKESKRLYFVCK